MSIVFDKQPGGNSVGDVIVKFAVCLVFDCHV